ncbi:MAG: tRNA (adenosine(37)-N6)-threonylcarbamoyltransferase complex dimerization subunit type 1 TsaB [Chloroflexi bacterium 44-23]|nr:MAG: tRNA (adenosine(37)-N6)-threonylcarbamoyltransferase complex dimerization subunit type 1 TsaB [Chloroflexi bacterium 44-23]
MIFALDSSTSSVGLAIYDGIQVIGEINWLTNNHHTVELAPAIQSLIQRTGVPLSDLKVLAVALGPGSFTSLRIGMALVKGLSLSLRIPVIGIPTLDFLAFSQAARNIPMLAVLQAGRSRFAVGRYKQKGGNWHRDGENCIMTIDELVGSIEEPTYICGELSAEDRQILNRKRRNIVLSPPVQSMRRASFLAAMGWKQFKASNFVENKTLAPIYLHIANQIP